MSRSGDELTADQHLSTLLGVLTLLCFVPVPFAVAHQGMAPAIVAVWVISVHYVENLAADSPSLSSVR